MKLSPAQATLLHVAESAASSALLTLIIGILQQLATHQISYADLLTVFGSGFVAAMGLIYKTVRSNASFAQAENDTLTEVKDLIETRFSAIEARFRLVSKPIVLPPDASPVPPRASQPPSTPGA